MLGIGVTDPTNGTRVWKARSVRIFWLGDHLRRRRVRPARGGVRRTRAGGRDRGIGTDSDKPWMIRELCLHQLMHITDATVVVTTLSGDESKPALRLVPAAAYPGGRYMPARRWSEACSRLRSRLRSTRRQRLGWIRTIFIGGEAPVSSMVLLSGGSWASPSLAPVRLGPPSGCRRRPNKALGGSTCTR